MTVLRHAWCGVLIACAIVCDHGLAQPPAAPVTRPFRMGFTRWPADLSLDGFLTAQESHMSYDVPRPIPADILDFAQSFGKPLAVAESGMTSRDVELKACGLTLRGSEADQTRFTEVLLRTAAQDCRPATSNPNPP